VDARRLRTDAAYRREQEDRLDLEENLGRSAADVAGTDAAFVVGLSLVTVGLFICVRRWVLRR
jgi:hypothetical protein